MFFLIFFILLGNIINGFFFSITCEKQHPSNDHRDFFKPFSSILYIYIYIYIVLLSNTCVYSITIYYVILKSIVIRPRFIYIQYYYLIHVYVVLLSIIWYHYLYSNSSTSYIYSITIYYMVLLSIVIHPRLIYIYIYSITIYYMILLSIVIRPRLIYNITI